MNFIIITCVTLLAVIASATGQRRPTAIDRARDISLQEMDIILAECRRRIAINNTMSHYVSIPSDCSAYAACEHPERGLVASIMLCPAGLYFDDSMNPTMLTCNFAALVDCFARGSRDRCSGMPDGFNPDTVRIEPDRGAYYECRNGRTIGGGMCDRGEQYWRTGQACLSIPDYRPAPVIPTTPAKCDLGEILSDRTTYMHGGMVRPCAPGTVFKREMCGCDYA